MDTASSSEPTSSAPEGSATVGGHRLTFVGNATTILRLGTITLLTDPNFLHRGQRAYLGKGLWSRRLLEPALQPDQLPALDGIVLSHLHGDHFDRVAKKGLDRAVPIVSTPAARRKLRQWGFPAEALRTWEQHTFSRGADTVTVTALPGTHARGVMRALLPPVMGSLVEHSVGGQVRKRVYLTGDTLAGDHLDPIRERFPDIDVAVVHLGGTRVLLHTVTMDGPQGADLLRRVQPRRVVPVHYDDYGVMVSPLSDFVDRVGAGGPALSIPGRGETIDI